MEDVTGFGGMGISGHFRITEINLETGETEIICDEKNRIVSGGFSSLLSGISRVEQNPFGFSRLVLGNDIGGGDVDNPEAAGRDMSVSDQSVVYEIPSESISIDFPDPNKVRFTTVIDGDDLYKKTNEPRNMFTSASIRNNRGDVVAYKRFSGRTSSPLLAFNIMWTISLTPIGTIGTPQPIDPTEPTPETPILGIIFYVMSELDTSLVSPDPISPEELSQGVGSYTSSYTIPRDNDSLYVIALMDVGEEDLVAVEWDEGVSTTGGVTLTPIGEVNITYPKSYIMKVSPIDAKSSIGVCYGHVCSDLWINK